MWEQTQHKDVGVDSTQRCGSQLNTKTGKQETPAEIVTEAAVVATVVVDKN